MKRTNKGVSGRLNGIKSWKNVAIIPLYKENGCRVNAKITRGEFAKCAWKHVWQNSY